MTVQFSELENEIKPEVPQADRLILIRSVRRAVRKFCDKTRVLETKTNPLLDIVSDQAEYTLPGVVDREIVGVQRGGVWWGTDYEIKPKSPDELDLDAGLPDSYRLPAGESVEAGLNFSQVVTPWRLMSDAKPIFFYESSVGTLRLVPIPNANYSKQLEVTYALKPSRTATEIDDFIIDQWYEDIVLGALAELLQIKGKAWTDVREGEKKELQFDMRLGEITSERVRAFAHEDKSVGKVRAWP